MTQQVDRRSLVRASTASLTGTSLEYDDAAVCSAASALVLPKLFFPSDDHGRQYGPPAACITEPFSPRLRSTGSSLGHTVAGVFGGALASPQVLSR